MNNFRSSKRIDKLTQNLIQLDLPTPRCVKSFYNKHVKLSIGRGYEFADVITERNGLLFQRIFCFQLHDTYATCREIARCYEGGDYVLSNWCQAYMNPVLAYDKYDETDYESGWNPNYCDIRKFNKKLMVTNPRFHLNEKQILKKYPYTAWDEYTGDLSLFEYLIKYKKNNGIEYLVKAGYSNYVSSINALNVHGKGFEEIFGVPKKFAQSAKNMNINDIRLLKKCTWIDNEEQLKCLKESLSWINSYSQHSISEKELKYIVKKNCKPDYYIDYLKNAEKCGYPLNEHKYRFPKDIVKAHDEAMKKYEFIKNKENDKKIAKLSEVYSKYKYEKNGLCIFPQTSTEDLINESKALDHCVRTYAEKVAEGKSCIFFIRKTDEINKPYVTLELAGKSNSKKLNQVTMCYGYHNTDPGDEVKQFVSDWKHKFNLQGIYA